MSDEAFWSRIAAFVGSIDERSYYELLRIRKDATPDEVRTAFYHWARQLHPDRFAREVSADRKWQLSLLYARMREAYAVLAEPGKRADYDDGLRRGVVRLATKSPRRGPDRAALPRDERARRFYKLGVERSRAGAKAEALFQFQMALQMEPDSVLIKNAIADAGGPPVNVSAASSSRASSPARVSAAPKLAAPEPAAPSMRRPGAQSMRSRRGREAAAAPPRTAAVPPRAPAAEPPRTTAVPPPRAPAAPGASLRKPSRSAAAVPRGVQPVSAPRVLRAGGGAASSTLPGEPAAVVGIDFGTTRSSISVALGDKVYALTDHKSRTLHPSVVHYPDRGPAVCGWQARELVYRQPRRTVASPKRLLGKLSGDPAVAGMLHSTAYETSSGPNGAIVIEMKGMQAAIPQVCAQIVSHIRDIGERRIGRPIERAVFSIPVGYGERERAAVQAVARISGLELVSFVDEPVAAAMAYGFGQNKHEIVAVYDFGGGTFDFTVIDMEGYHFDVLTRGGDTWLGGDDFDSAIAKAVANALWRATGVEVQNRQVEWQRLVFACEKAKRELSLRRGTHIVVDKLIEAPKPMNIRQPFTRPLLARLCGPLFERSLQICRASLDRVGLDPGDIQQVVASGGISHIPFVREGLSKFFGREITVAVNPDEAICLGAGFRAAQLSKRPVLGVGML